MKSKAIVAIGGGEIGENETLPIDKRIIALSEKKIPRVLFIPTASSDAEGYWKVFHSIYGARLSCKTDVLYLIREKLTKSKIKEKIDWADIIYVGGGNTLKMMKVWRKKGIDHILEKAYENGTIMTGLSAGAICWFRYGSSDSRLFMNKGKSNKLMRVRGLNFINCTVSPHHIREKNSRVPGMRRIMMHTSGVGLGIDDNAALLIQDDGYEIITSKKNVGIQKFFRRKNDVICTPIPKKGTLNALLKKFK